MRTLMLALALTAASTAAAVPYQFQHQGRLADATGVPLEGSTDVTFSLWDDPSSGNELWTEQRTLNLDNGHYSTILGDNSTTPLELNDVPVTGLYLQIQVGTEPPLDRLAVVSVPYAIRADVATNVSGGTVDATSVSIDGTEVIQSDGTFVGTMSFDSLTDLPTGLDDGSDDDTLASLSCSGTDQVAVWDGSLWTCGDAPAAPVIPADNLDGTIPTTNLLFGDTDGTIASGSHTHPAEDVVSGTLDAQRLPNIPYALLPVGSDSTTVARGDHAHSYAFSDISGTIADSQLPTDLTASGNLSAGGTVTIGGDGAACTTAGTLRYNETSGDLEFCNGSDWLNLGLGRGASQANPASSCLDAYNSGGRTSGAYWINPAGGTAYQVYCDQETDGGGWTLVMKQAANAGPGSALANNVWSGWSSANQTIAPDDATLNDGNMVNLAYSELDATSLRMTASETWTDLSSGGWDRTINTTPFDALQDSNANTTVPNGTTANPWTAGGSSFTTSSRTTTTGAGLNWRGGPVFNLSASWQYVYGIKWGWVFNNEASVSTADTAQGLGCCANGSWYRTSPWTLYVWAR